MGNSAAAGVDAADFTTFVEAEGRSLIDGVVFPDSESLASPQP